MNWNGWLLEKGFSVNQAAILAPHFGDFTRSGNRHIVAGITRKQISGDVFEGRLTLTMKVAVSPFDCGNPLRTCKGVLKWGKNRKGERVYKGTINQVN